MTTLSLATGTLDLDAGVLRVVDGQQRSLSTQEQHLLRYLVRRPNADVTREDLLTEVMGYSAGVNSRAVDDAIKRLRAKLERVPSRPFHLVGVRGVGYRFVPLAPASDGAGKQVRVHLGSRVVDLDRLTVTAPGEAAVTLSATEGRLLEVLLAHAGRPVPTTDLLREVWGVRDASQRRVVDKLVYRLRGKLESDPTNPVHLRTVRGRGLLLEATLVAPPDGRSPATASRPGQSVPELQASVFGRSAEAEELRQHLAQAGTLVTVHGPAGVGKSTLARQVLRAWEGVSRQADLAGCSGAAEVREALADAMGVDLEPGAPPHRLHAALSDVADLVLLVEHAEACLDAASHELDLVRRAAPDVRLVVTSRHPVGIHGERILRLQPLTLDEARQLLVARAAAAGVQLDGDDPRLDQLIEAVDRLPLALELAAARLRLLGLEGVMARLERPLDLFKRSASSDPRLVSLRTSLEQTWVALSPGEQELLVSVTLFGGAFSLEAAEYVLQPLVDIDVLDGLQRLLDFAVLRRTSEGRLAPFHGVSELIVEHRGGSLRRLAQDSRPALLRWYADLGGTPDPFGEPPPSAFRRLLPELAGAILAIERAGPDEDDRVARILGWVMPMLLRLGHTGRMRTLLPRARRGLRRPFAEVRQLHTIMARCAFTLLSGTERLDIIRATVTGARAAGDDAVEALALGEWLNALAESASLPEVEVELARGRMLIDRVAEHPLAESILRRGLGWYAFRQGDLDTAWTDLQESLGLARMAGLPWQESRAAHNLAGVCRSEGRLGEAETFLDLAQQPVSAVPQSASLLSVRDMLGLVWLEQGRLDEAEALHRDLIEHYRQTGQRESVARQANRLGTIEGQRGSPAAASVWFQQALTAVEAEGNVPWTAGCRYNLGECARRLGQRHSARQHYQAALEIYEQLGRRVHQGVVLGSMGFLSHTEGDDSTAEDLLRRALPMLDQSRARRQAAEARSMLAEVLGASDEGWALASQAVDELQAIGLSPTLVSALARQADLARQRGDATKARVILDQGRALANRLDMTAQSEGMKALEQAEDRLLQV